MRRFPALIAVLAVVAAACGGTTAETTSPADGGQSGSVNSPAPASSNAPAPTDPDAPSTPGSGEAPPETDSPSAPSFDGPPAPDFELALETGGTVALSAEAKPVYMVFWAEW